MKNLHLVREPNHYEYQILLFSCFLIGSELINCTQFSLSERLDKASSFIYIYVRKIWVSFQRLAPYEESSFFSRILFHWVNR